MRAEKGLVTPGAEANSRMSDPTSSPRPDAASPEVVDTSHSAGDRHQLDIYVYLTPKAKVAVRRNGSQRTLQIEEEGENPWAINITGRPDQLAAIEKALSHDASLNGYQFIARNEDIDELLERMG